MVLYRKVVKNMIQKQNTMSNNAKEDSRTIRSKRDLANALEELLQEKNYDDIGIKEITDKAMVSKNTFYNNFNEKNDLLRFVFERLEENLMKEVKPFLDKAKGLHPTKYIFLTKCIDTIIHFFYTGNLPLKKMIQQDKSHTLYFELSSFIKDLLNRMDKIYDNLLSNRLNQEVASIFYGGAFASLVYFSIQDNVEISEKALEKSVRLMVFPAIE